MVIVTIQTGHFGSERNRVNNSVKTAGVNQEWDVRTPQVIGALCTCWRAVSNSSQWEGNG